MAQDAQSSQALLALVYAWFLDQNLKETAHAMMTELHKNAEILVSKKPKCSLSSVVSVDLSSVQCRKQVGRKECQKATLLGQQDRDLNLELLSMIHIWFLQIGCKGSASSMLSEIEPNTAEAIDNLMPRCSLTALFEKTVGQQSCLREALTELDMDSQDATRRIHKCIRGSWTKHLVTRGIDDVEVETNEDAIDARPLHPFFELEAEESDQQCSSSSEIEASTGSEIDHSIPWQSKGPYIGVSLLRTFLDQPPVKAVVTQWAPAGEAADEPALWHVVHVDGDEEDLEFHELEAGLKAFQLGLSRCQMLSKGAYIGVSLLRTFPDQPPVKAVVTRWAPAGEAAGKPALWHVVHANGDEEDLEFHELEAAIEAFQEFKTQARSQRKRLKNDVHP